MERKKHSKQKVIAIFILMILLFNSLTSTVYGFITDINGNAEFGVIKGSLATYRT